MFAASHLSIWLLDAALKATLVLTLAALLARVLLRREARLRQIVWTVALLGILVVPPLTWAGARWQVPLLQSALTWIEAEAPTPAGMPVLLPHGRDRAKAALPAGDASRFIAAPTHVAEPARSVPWSRIGVRAWGAGALACFGWLVLGLDRVRRLARAASPAPGWRPLGRDLTQRLGLHSHWRILESDAVEAPMTWGWIRPVVLMPTSAATWSAERRELVLLHELVHVQRRDWLLQMLAQLARCLYWFHPLAWVAQRRLRIERERACDERVIAFGTAPSRYATHLLSIALSPSARSPLPSATLAMAHRSQLEERLMSILEQGHDARRGTALLAPLALLMGGTVLSLAAVRTWSPSAQHTDGHTHHRYDDEHAQGDEHTIHVRASDRLRELHEHLKPALELLRPFEERIEHIHEEMRPFHEHMEVIHEEMAPFHEHMEHAHREMAPLHERIEHIHREMAPFHRRLETIDSEMAPLREQAEVIERRNAPLRERIEHLRLRLAPLHERLRKLRNEGGASTRELDELQGATDELRGDLDSMIGELDPSTEQLNALHDRLRPFHERLERVHQEMAPYHERVERIHQEMRPHHERLQTIEREMRPFHERIEHVQREMAPFHERIEERPGLEPLQEQIEAIHRELAPFHERLERVHEEMEPLRQETEPIHELMTAEISHELRAVVRSELAGTGLEHATQPLVDAIRWGWTLDGDSIRLDLEPGRCRKQLAEACHALRLESGHWLSDPERIELEGALDRIAHELPALRIDL